MQSFQKRHKRGCLRWAEVFSIGRHISSALDHLANQLIFGKTDSNGVQRRSALSPFVIQRMAVMTLLGLKNQRTLPFHGRASMYVLWRDWLAAPCVHDGAPGSVLS